MTQEKAIEWSTEIPTKDGWYEVRWDPNNNPTVVYVHCAPDGVVWGWAENDDPEFVSLEECEENGTLWRLATATQANEARKWFDLCRP